MRIDGDNSRYHHQPIFLAAKPLIRAAFPVSEHPPRHRDSPIVGRKLNSRHQSDVVSRRPCLDSASGFVNGALGTRKSQSSFNRVHRPGERGGDTLSSKQHGLSIPAHEKEIFT